MYPAESYKIKIVRLQAQWASCAAALQEGALVLAEDDFKESNVTRSPDGRFAPKGGGGGSSGDAGDAGKQSTAKSKSGGSGASAENPLEKREYKDAMEAITKKLDKADPRFAKALDELAGSPEMHDLQKEIGQLLTKETPVLEEVAHQAAHGAHGGTGAAIALGAAMDLVTSSISKDFDKLADPDHVRGLENQTEWVKGICKIASKAGPLGILLFGSFAPEILLGAAAPEAFTTAMIQVAAVKPAVEKAESLMEEKEIENPIVKKLIELTVMGLAGGLSREAWMKIGGHEKSLATAQKLSESLNKVMKKADTLAKKGDAEGLTKLMEANFSESTNKALDTVSTKVVEAAKAAKAAKGDSKS